MATRNARRTASASPSVALVTIRPEITFLHSDGSVAGTDGRALRVVAKGPNKGKFGVERRGKVMPITITGPRSATCVLTAEPLAQGYAKGDAQTVAPCATLADLGIEGKAKPKASEPAAPAKGRRGAKASTTAKLEAAAGDAVANLIASLKGKPQAEVEMAFMQIAKELAAPSK